MKLNKPLISRLTVTELREFMCDIIQYKEERDVVYGEIYERIYDNPNLNKDFILEYLNFFNYFELQKYGFEEQDFVKYLDRLNDKSWKSIPAKYRELITLEVIESFKLTNFNQLAQHVIDPRFYQKYCNKIDLHYYSYVPVEVFLDWDFFKTWVKDELLIEWIDLIEHREEQTHEKDPNNIGRKVISTLSEDHLLYMLQDPICLHLELILKYGTFDLDFFDKYLLDRMKSYLWEFLSKNRNIDWRILVKYENNIIYADINTLNVPFPIIRKYFPFLMKNKCLNLTNKGAEKYGLKKSYNLRHYYINNKIGSFKMLKIDF